MRNPRASRPRRTSASTYLNYKTKPVIFPSGFVLLQDTREQRGLFTRLPSGLVLMSTTLQDGDYSILGFEDKFAIERKGISDLVPYCSKEREKTLAKMKRFQKFEFVGLVIEVTENEALSPYEFSMVSPESVRQAIVSFEVRYGVHVYYSNSRDNVCRWVLDRAVKYWTIKHKV